MCARLAQGAVLQLTIDDASNGNGIDLTRQETVSPWPDDPREYAVCFSLDGQFDIEPGDLISLSNGGITRLHTAQYLTVTRTDAATDIVTGNAEPGAEVLVWLYTGNNYIMRVETANSEGIWTANYAIPGDTPGETATFDLQPGNYGHARIEDEDGDATQFSWKVLSSVVWAHPNDSGEDWIDARDWFFGETLHLTIDNDTDPANGVLYTDSGVVGPANWNPSVGIKEFHLGGFDLRPGHIVTVAGPMITKILIITNFDITDIDTDLDTISGTAVAGSTVQAWFHEEHNCNVEVDADENGGWMVDFYPCNIRPGVGGGIGQKDADEDSTVYFWRVPNPTIGVRANEDRVEGWEWPMRATITLAVDDPFTPADPDITRFANAYEAPWNPGEFRFDLDLRGVIDIQPGFEVTASDGSITKTHVVMLLEVTDVDLDNEMVYGIADPNQQVNIWTCWQNDPCVNREVFADANGEWVANFAIPGAQNWEQETADLRPGSWIDSSVHDEDFDQTMFGRTAPNPTFSVRMRENEVHGYEWTFGTPVTLSIDDPGTPQAIDYTKTETVTFADWDPNQTFVQFRLWEDDFTLQPGMFVTMTDGSISKTHTTTDLVVLGADAENDTVWGTGTPDTWVEVGHLCDKEGCAIRRTVIAPDGAWLVDFSVADGTEPDEQKTYDITECYGNEARQHDEDGDSTQYGWDAYCPPQIAFEHYLFNLENPLLDNLTMRQAIALGTDRQRILDEAFLSGGEYGQLVNVPVPPGHPYQAPASEITTYSYNPAESESLLAAAGWVDEDGDSIREKDGQRLAFVFKTTLNPLRVIAAQIFRENMAAIGIEINVVYDPNFLAPDGALVNQDFDIAEFAWLTALDYDGDLLDLYLSDNEQNYGGYVSPDYDATQTAFHNATTEDERIAAILAAQQILTADLPAFYLFTRESITPPTRRQPAPASN